MSKANHITRSQFLDLQMGKPVKVSAQSASEYRKSVMAGLTRSKIEAGNKVAMPRRLDRGKLVKVK